MVQIQSSHLLYRGPNDRPKFQEHLKKLLSAEICQIETQTKKNPQLTPVPKKISATFKSPLETSIIKERPHKIPNLPTNS